MRPHALFRLGHVERLRLLSVSPCVVDVQFDSGRRGRPHSERRRSFRVFHAELAVVAVELVKLLARIQPRLAHVAGKEVDGLVEARGLVDYLIILADVELLGQLDIDVVLADHALIGVLGAVERRNYVVRVVLELEHRACGYLRARVEVHVVERSETRVLYPVGKAHVVGAVIDRIVVLHKVYRAFVVDYLIGWYHHVARLPRPVVACGGLTHYHAYRVPA